MSIHSRYGGILPVSFFTTSTLATVDGTRQASTMDGKGGPSDVDDQNVIKTTMAHLSNEQK
jgi:hypothetical protein